MALIIDTFSNQTGAGSAFFKAIGHPLCVEQAQKIVADIRASQNVAVFDPQNSLSAFASLHGLAKEDFIDVYVQSANLIGATVLGHATLPITDIAKMERVDLLFIPIFDAGQLLGQIRHLVPAGCHLITLDDMRLPDRFLSDTRRYLNPINFATNLLFFRDTGTSHMRLVTANYWGAYGAKSPFLWARLFDSEGGVLADFEKPLGGANELFELDSAQLKQELNLPNFCGQVFLHVVGAAGHDIVKYVVDSYGSGANAQTELSCTHDANSWPADLYAGVPAPSDGDTVTFWIQNSHPTPIPPNTIGFSRMGGDNLVYFPDEIKPYATQPVDLGALLPDVKWPAQYEIHAGKHFVRPRYEVTNQQGCRRINHANVQRTDLSIDPNLPNLSPWVGKGYLLPAPILPRRQFVSECLPTPMSTAQQNLPYTAVVYDSQGTELQRQFLGCLPRDHACLLNLTQLVQCLPEDEVGHVELLYDFRDGGGGDGWMHALFRYTEIASGYTAETSFGAHMFNHLITYKNEPQSYKGPPPGLSTRLFLRLADNIADNPVRTMCHLTYPVGAKWHATSNTHLELKNRQGEQIASRIINIAENGCYLFYCDEVFSTAELQQAGQGAYVFIRDTTCRLFGYHGARVGKAFAFDHMFGF